MARTELSPQNKVAFATGSARNTSLFRFCEELKEQDVRALQILQERFRDRLEFVHQSRWRALWRVVSALIVGRRLWLTALGRALPGSALPKHAIKAVDRLLGNEHLHAERFAIAAALASTIVREGSQPIVLVDTVEIRHKIVALTAAIAFEGRSFPIWSTIVSHVRPKARECRRFLHELSFVLAGCRPLLVTDAGFEGPWFSEVERYGWDYIGRLRGQVTVHYDGRWVRMPELHRLATKRAKNLGQLRIGKGRSSATRRIVLSKLPTCRHRQIKTRRGPARGRNYRVYRANAYEPLVLVSSLTSEPNRIVAVYKLRMQIEQAFRDLKNHRWGWSLRHCGTRSKPRLELLLLIGAIALLVQQLVGISAERHGLHRAHQANTVRKRRVLSVFVLGGLILNSASRDGISQRDVARAIKDLRDRAAYRNG